MPSFVALNVITALSASMVLALLATIVHGRIREMRSKRSDQTAGLTGVDVSAIYRTIAGEPHHVVRAVVRVLEPSVAHAVLGRYPLHIRRELSLSLARYDVKRVPPHA